MDRRSFLMTSLAGVVAALLGIKAQPANVPRVGVLSPGSAGPSPLLAAFRQGLRELDFVEKETVVLEYRFAETKLEKLPALAAELGRA